MKFICLAIAISLISACSSTRYLGTKQPSLASSACSIETEQCFFSASGLTLQGYDSRLDGSWFLDAPGNGNYYLNGSAKLSFDKKASRTEMFLDLTFVFFKGDLVVHEEKIRVRGGFNKYHKFSRIIKSEVPFDSSKWVWYEWRGT